MIQSTLCKHGGAGAAARVTNVRPPRGKVRGVVLLALVGALIVSLIVAWFAGLRNQFEPVNFGVVEPGRLFRSGQISGRIVEKTLQQHHIGLIVNLTGDDTPDAHAEQRIAKEIGVREVHLGLSGDGLGDPTVYPRALAQIVEANRAGTAVLVHCQSGAQRTGGVIAAYRILVEGESPDNAFAEMRRYGHDPRHNPALIPFIRQHLAQWKVQLKRDERALATAATQPAR